MTDHQPVSAIPRGLEIDRISTQFEQELKAGLSPQIETFVAEARQQIRSGLFEELLNLEVWYARLQGVTPSIPDYLRRFPAHTSIVYGCFGVRNMGSLGDSGIHDLSGNSSVVDGTPSTVEFDVAPRCPRALPEQFGRYRILQRLGTGGMGTVFLAKDGELDRLVALKVPRFEEPDQEKSLSRFRREAQIAARVLHPNLCPVYDIGEVDGVFYLTMAYIEGEPLSHHLQQRRPVNIRYATRIIRTVAEALTTAHTQGIVHRDLKPSNIMLNPKGEPVVVDFGLASTQLLGESRLTAFGSMVGTPAYASPEQIQGVVDVDERSDVYSLGIILYELLTGTLPFEDSSPHGLFQQILNKIPHSPSNLRPQIPRELDLVCLQAIAKRAEDRFPNMQAMAQALEEWDTRSVLKEDSRPDWFKPTMITPVTNAEDHEERTEGEDSTADTNGTSVSLRQRCSNVPRLLASQVRRLEIVAITVGLAAMCVVMMVIIGILLFRGRPATEPSPLPSPFAKPDPRPPETEDPREDNEDPDDSTPDQPPPPDPGDFRVQLPVPVGGWTKLTGSLWHPPLPADGSGIDFTVHMRCVADREIDKRPYQVLEISVETENSNYHEQASLLVDIEAYQKQREFVVREGWLLAPRENVHVRYNAERDALAEAMQIRDLKMPALRLSVQDILALLFQADVKTTNPMFHNFHKRLLLERMLESQGLTIRTDPNRPEFNLVETQESRDGQELPVEYTLRLGKDPNTVPFTWGEATVLYRSLGELKLKAVLKRVAGAAADAEARYSDPTWTPDAPDPLDYKDYAYLNLPLQTGARCEFHVVLVIGELLTKTLERVEIRVLDADKQHPGYRWIEVDVQSGGDLASDRIVETALLLINEERYVKDRKFEILEAWSRLVEGQGGDPLYVKFDFVNDRMLDLHGDKFDKSRRVPIRNVLSLLFGARLTPHFLAFDIRKEIAYTLTDARLRRHFVKDRPVRVRPEFDLKCTLVRPGRSVSLESNKPDDGKTLDYKIFVSTDVPEYQFQWVNIELDLFTEKNGIPDKRIFTGRLKLRDFDNNGQRTMPSIAVIRENDPDEVAAKDGARSNLALAKKHVEKGYYANAIERYEAIKEDFPGTLVAEEAQTEIDKLSRP